MKTVSTLIFGFMLLSSPGFAQTELIDVSLACSNGDRAVYIADDKDDQPAVWFRGGSLPSISKWNRDSAKNRGDFSPSTIDTFEDVKQETPRIPIERSTRFSPKGLATSFDLIGPYHDNPMDADGIPERRALEADNTETIEVSVPFQWDIFFVGGSQLSTRTVSIKGLDGTPRSRTFATIIDEDGETIWDTVPCFYLN
jgi:hypothetical protein